MTEGLTLPTDTRETSDSTQEINWVSPDDPLKQFLFRDRAIENEYDVPDTQRCSVCYETVLNLQFQYVRTRTTVKLTDVKARAQGGCCGCTLINSAFEKVHQKHIIDSTKIDTVFRQDSEVLLDVSIGGASGKMCLNIYSEYGDYIFDIFTFLDMKDDRMNIGESRIDPRFSSPLESMNLISQWLESCHMHTSCLQANDLEVHPARVLEINDTTVKLQNGSDATRPYLALSYCWGSRDMLRTTCSTIEDFRKNISEDKLPRTFRDAIRLARHLKVSYLWIDALCIIQDDPGDWARESAKMASIYEDAYLVVAATAAEDSDGGLFCGPGMYTPSLSFQTQLDDGTIAPVYIQFKIDHSYFPASEGLRNGTWDSKMKPLFDRAWTLQERLLATRIVHFSIDELVWECQSRVFCDCTYLDQRQGTNGSFRVQQIRPDAKFAIWVNLLNQYSRLSLTYPSDRLPAISGLVKHLQGRGLGEYVAGLWTEGILALLCWCSFEAPRHQKWQAPSWSWACAEFKSVKTAIPGDASHTLLRGRVSSSGTTKSQTTPQGKNFKSTFLSIDYKLEGEDPAGRVNWATLTISAPCINVRIRRGPHSHGRRTWHILHGENRMDTKQWSPTSGLDSPKDDFRGLGEIPCLVAWIATRWYSSRYYMGKYLILQHSRGLGGREPSPGCYERVGSFEFMYEGDDPFHDENEIFGWFDDAEVETVTIV